MRFRLRTLLIVLAILPPLLAAAWLVYRELEKVSDDVNRYYHPAAK